jgi:hypothetical protein
MKTAATPRLADASIPDAVMPEQFFSARRLRTGEERLMLGALADAIDRVRIHALRGTENQRAAASEARAWLASSDRSHPFAFESICDALDLDARAIRLWVLGWSANDGAATVPPRVRRGRVVRRRIRSVAA